MGDSRFLFSLALASVLASSAPLGAAGFGSVVTTVGGHPADIALDESRGQLYIANFTAMEVDVMSTKDNAIHSAIALRSHPSALALSPDSKYLVVAQYRNGSTAPEAFDGVTIIDLSRNSSKSIDTGDPVLGVAFVRLGHALVATAGSFFLLDPASGDTRFLSTVANLAQRLPVAAATFPPQIIQTQLTSSADGQFVWGVADGGTGTQLVFRYEVRTTEFNSQVWITTPALLPRVSSAPDGSWALIGWSQFAPSQCGGGLRIQSRYPHATASSSVTGHAIAPNSGLVYAQIFDGTQPAGPPYGGSTTAGPGKLPVLSIMDPDNLTVRDKIYIPENLVGRALFDSAGNYMYAISDSGVSVLPMGMLNKYPRLATSSEDVLVQTNFCNRSPLSATFTISDPGNNATDFAVSSSQNGVVVSPSSGKTPATITVTVQPGAIPNPGGTIAVPLTISSSTAVNAPPSVRLLINNPDQDQRGTVIDVPGQLIDLLPDAGRNRFYVARQDKNQVLVFDGSTYQQLATLRTGTTPTGMTITNDNKYLVVASTDSQVMQVFDLDTFQAQTPIELPGSHYGRSVAQSSGATFAVVENDGSGPGGLDVLNFNSRCAQTPATLGIFLNDVPAGAVLASSPNQRFIMVAEPNGTLMLYDANYDTFVLSRKDLSSLSGAYAVSSSGDGSSSGPSFSTRYLVGDNVFDAALVPQGTLDTSVGRTSGFAFTGAGGYRVTGTGASAAGGIQKMPDIIQGAAIRPVRTVESPILGSASQPFTRTVAPLSNGIVVLSTSGLTVLPPDFDAAVSTPSITAVVNAADGTQPVAPGGLISVYGSGLGQGSMAASQTPLPTTMGASCLAVNGVPVPLLYMSGGQINAQLPFNAGGSSTAAIHSPGGISSTFKFNVQASAPSVFQTGSTGPMTGLATIVRADNNQLVTPTNPIHPKDTIIIYLTGMGVTLPSVDAGAAAPISPLSWVTNSPSLLLGGAKLDVQYAGLVPGEVGVYQINAYVPFGVPQGNSIPLVISQGGSSTTLNVRVVN